MRKFKHAPECITQLDDPDESECTCGAWDKGINEYRLWENVPEELSLKTLIKEIDELALSSNVWEARYCIELAKRAISENKNANGAQLAASILRDLWVTEQAEVRSLCFSLEKGNATKGDLMGVIDIMNTWMFKATCEHKIAYGSEAGFIVCQQCKKHLDDWPKESANNE